MHEKKHQSYYTAISVLFVAVLLISNITSTKIVDLGSIRGLPIIFDGGTILFPLSYIFCDILTEIYGLRKAKQTIWLGFISAGLLSLCIWIVGALPPAADWPFQEAYQSILGYTPRIILGSLLAYLAGEFANAISLSTIKTWTQGKKFWLRAIGSTILGQGIDTVIFVLVAFWGVLPTEILIAIILTNYIFKVLIEVVMLPGTYRVRQKLQKIEHTTNQLV